MQKFNTTSLITGYIKQLLHEFNLPKCRVYTQEHAQYAESHRGKERFDIIESLPLTADNDLKNQVSYVPYIRQNHLQIFQNGSWQNLGQTDSTPNSPHIHHYSYGQKILNLTKNLVIKNNVYDSYTHEYLGEYLRFKRDFEGINLLPFYNCFSNKLCPALDLKPNGTAVFNSLDPQYKIYMVPVKFFKNYTIAIDSATPIELCCGFYHHYQTQIIGDGFLKTLSESTYEKVNCCIFSQPFIFNKLMNIDNFKEHLSKLIRMEEALKLFIKVPATNQSTIVILEGNYANWNDTSTSFGSKENFEYGLQLTPNHSLINLEPLFSKSDITLLEYAQANLPLICPLQLLQGNIQEQIAFADRLIEYLVENTITDSATELPGNIEKIQKLIKLHIDTMQNVENKTDAWNQTVQNKYKPRSEQTWEAEFNKIFYEQLVTLTQSTKNSNAKFQDILGFMDREIETAFSVKTTDGIINMSTVEEDW